MVSRYPVPDGETMDSFLASVTCEGARRRYTGANGMPTYQRALPADRSRADTDREAPSRGLLLHRLDIITSVAMRKFSFRGAARGQQRGGVTRLE